MGARGAAGRPGGGGRASCSACGDDDDERAVRLDGRARTELRRRRPHRVDRRDGRRRGVAAAMASVAATDAEPRRTSSGATSTASTRRPARSGRRTASSCTRSGAGDASSGSARARSSRPALQLEEQFGIAPLRASQLVTVGVPPAQALRLDGGQDAEPHPCRAARGGPAGDDVAGRHTAPGGRRGGPGRPRVAVRAARRADCAQPRRAARRRPRRIGHGRRGRRRAGRLPVAPRRPRAWCNCTRASATRWSPSSAARRTVRGANGAALLAVGVAAGEGGEPGQRRLLGRRRRGRLARASRRSAPPSTPRRRLRDERARRRAGRERGGHDEHGGRPRRGARRAAADGRTRRPATSSTGCSARATRTGSGVRRPACGNRRHGDHRLRGARVRPRHHPRVRSRGLRALLPHRPRDARQRPDAHGRRVPGMGRLLARRRPMQGEPVTTRLAPRLRRAVAGRGRRVLARRARLPATAPTASRARGRSTATTTTAASCSTPTATASRPCTTAPCAAAASTTCGSASRTSPRRSASTRPSPRTRACALRTDTPDRAHFAGEGGLVLGAARRRDDDAASTWRSRRRTTPTVQAFHAAATAAGYADNGPPGERAVYHPGYYGAFVLDPDGHNVEVVNHHRD